MRPLRAIADRLARRRRGRRPIVVHSPGPAAAPPGGLHDPWRAARILDFLVAERRLAPKRIEVAPDVSLRELRRVHGLDYLESLERPGALERVFGERLPDALERRLVAAQKRMAGGTALAARRALEGGVAVHLGGGLHHARADRGAGFCLIHDVAVAVAALRAEGFDRRIAVVDLDLHDGDGTRALFAADPTVHTYSVHNRGWEAPATAAAPEPLEDTAIELGAAVGDARYLEAIRDTLPALLDRFAPELAFYLAGVDPADDDALGDWRITAAGLAERDRRVFEELARRRVPFVVLLAGGYGRHAWRHTARSLAALFGGGRPLEPPSTADQVVARFRHLAEALPRGELAGGTGEALLDEDDLAEIFEAPGGRSRRFLGFYTAAGVELALERIGYLDLLRSLGFDDARVTLDAGGARGDTVRVTAGPDGADLLVELRARRERRALPGFELLWIEWLLLQNPRLDFTAERPALPGQKHPGLGLLLETMAAMVLVCDRLGLDGIGVTASHFHPAAQGPRDGRLLDPADEPVFAALLDAVRGLPLDAACRAVEQGGLVDPETGRPFAWRPLSLVYPVSDRLREHLARRPVPPASVRFERRPAGAAPAG
jgi:acetoin utilization deacetylase AcuC-like enzyme